MNSDNANDRMLTFFTGRPKNERISKERAIKFPLKLMYTLECGDYNHIITWSLVDGGLSFFIIDARAFTKHVLPALFKEAKFDSFQRKIYRWGFVKNKRSKRGSKAMLLSFSHPYFRKGDFELASKMTCSGPGSASNRTTSLFTSPLGSNESSRSTGTDLMVGATYPTATGGYQDIEARNTITSSPTFVDGVCCATVPPDVMGQQRRKGARNTITSSTTLVGVSATVRAGAMGQHRRHVLDESSLGLRRDPVLLSMFGNGGGVARSSGGVLLGRLPTAENDSRFYQVPAYYHHDPCHHRGGLQNRNAGMDSQHISSLSSSFSTSNPFQQSLRCLSGMDSLHRCQQPPSLKRIATPRQVGRFSSGVGLVSMRDQQSIIQDALDVLQLA